jgi:hypothetical protein
LSRITPPLPDEGRYVKTQAKSPLTRSNLNLRLIVEDKETIEHERKKRR